MFEVGSIHAYHRRSLLCKGTTATPEEHLDRLPEVSLKPSLLFPEYSQLIGVSQIELWVTYLEWTRKQRAKVWRPKEENSLVGLELTLSSDKGDVGQYSCVPENLETIHLVSDSVVMFKDGFVTCLDLMYYS
jgi:hypothetical protein